jgi:diguanylate cyclase (GGDEF)-like protein
MRMARASNRELRRILLPSLAAAFLPFALLWLPPAHWQKAPLILAAVASLAIVAAAATAPWKRLPGWTPSLLAFAYLAVVVLLRAAGGPSGVAPMALLPVFWVAVCGTRPLLWLMLAAVAVVFGLPFLVGGIADTPPGAWRAAVLLVAVSGLLGVTMQTLVARVREQERERDRLLDLLHGLAHTDELTGLRNRRAWEAELERGLSRAVRTRDPLTVAVIDVDNFKLINDRAGHAEGDALLGELARSWGDALRPDDVLARIGGDEFALLMPACSEVEAGAVIDRLRELMPRPYSCSVGLATWDGQEPAQLLMRRADDALYEAKRGGRDRAAAAVLV